MIDSDIKLCMRLLMSQLCEVIRTWQSQVEEKLLKLKKKEKERKRNNTRQMIMRKWSFFFC